MASCWQALVDAALDAAEASPSDMGAIAALRSAIPKGQRVPCPPGCEPKADNPVYLLWRCAKNYVWPQNRKPPIRVAAHRTEYRRGQQENMASLARTARAWIKMCEGEGAA